MSAAEDPNPNHKPTVKVADVLGVLELLQTDKMLDRSMVVDEAVRCVRVCAWLRRTRSGSLSTHRTFHLTLIVYACLAVAGDYVVHSCILVFPFISEHGPLQNSRGRRPYLSEGHLLQTVQYPLACCAIPAQLSPIQSPHFCSFLNTAFCSKVEADGLIFLQDIDKLCDRERYPHAECAQLDLLSLLEGGPVLTRYGIIETRNVCALFPPFTALAIPRPFLPPYSYCA